MQKSADCQAADRNDQLRSHDPQLPVTPKLAKLLLAWSGRAIPAAEKRPTRVTARDRRAVERRVELFLVELEPAAQRSARATAPRASFLAFDESRRLPVHVGALIDTFIADRPGLEGKSCFDARPAHAQVALQRLQRAVRRTTTRQART